MSDIAIRVENLSKQYRIGKLQQQSTLRDSISHAVNSSFARLRSPGLTDPKSTILSLKGVSFEVKQGEVVGIIGRNGAGKSTLLKILSRITDPTEGHVQIRGRVASLLEVGTGFHAELTGRENIYLNGAILGMKRAEIARKFDEIVAFAEVEKFIDTPVKRYSSGMYLRLAFAVAAHLEPEILLVDEVLAVGDAQFQKKSLGKLGDVATAGRTVLFVSHNMAAVRRLCSVTILLKNGEIVTFGRTDEVLRVYENQLSEFNGDNSELFPIVNSKYGLALEGVIARMHLDKNCANLEVKVQLSSRVNFAQIGIGIWLHTYDGTLISKMAPSVTGNIVRNLNGRCTCILGVDHIEQYLAAGDYKLSVALSIPRIEQLIVAETVAVISVPPFDIYETGVAFESTTFGLVPLKMKLNDVSPMR